jgi:hypothetical protein
MPAKNDLSAYKTKASQSTLISTPKAEEHEASPLAPARGRKAKSVEDKESETLALKFTKAEMDALTRKAGLVPKGSFVKHILRTQTDLFK